MDWVLPIALALLSLAVSGWANYNRTDKELTNRVTAVEVQQKNDGQRLERIENKLDRVLEAVRR